MDTVEFLDTIRESKSVAKFLAVALTRMRDFFHRVKNKDGINKFCVLLL